MHMIFFCHESVHVSWSTYILYIRVYTVFFLKKCNPHVSLQGRLPLHPLLNGTISYCRLCFPPELKSLAWGVWYTLPRRIAESLGDLQGCNGMLVSHLQINTCAYGGGKVSSDSSLLMVVVRAICYPLVKWLIRENGIYHISPSHSLVWLTVYVLWRNCFTGTKLFFGTPW